MALNCPILVFQERVWDEFLHHILCMMFQEKCFSWSNFIVWLLLPLEILGNMCITIVCEPRCDVIKFEINLIFLIKPFCYMTKKSRQKLKYLENENSLWDEIKSIFHHFLKAFSCQKLSQTWKWAFKKQSPKVVL